MFSDPSRNVAYFGLIEGARVADFGAGSGAYTIELSKRVGATGLVYAVEVQKVLLDRLAQLGRAERLSNVKFIWGDVDKLGGSKLPDQSCDLVLLANILFQSDSKYTLVLEAKRVLRPTGRVVVIDWSATGGLGPPVDRLVPAETAKNILAEAGFELASDFSAGEHHYGLIFKPQSKS